MIIKDEITKIIYNSNNFNIYGLRKHDKCILKFNPEITLKKGVFVEIDGDIEETTKGPCLVAQSIKEIDKIEAINLLALTIDGISENKADEIMSTIGSYEVLKKDPFIIFDFFMTNKNKQIFEQIQEHKEDITEEEKEDAAKHIGKIVKGIGPKKILQWMDDFETIYPYDTQLFLEKDLIIKYLVSETTMNIYNQIRKFDKIEEQFNKLVELKIPLYIINYLFKDYKTNVYKELTNNPYLLLNFGLSFDFVDEIAINHFKIKQNNETRIINCILYLIKEKEKDGHTFVIQDEILDNAMELLQIDDTTIANVYLAELNKELESEFILKDKKLYRRVIYFTERKLEKLLTNKIYESKNIVAPDIVKYLTSTTLSNEQSSAVLNMLKNKISILTGGPGTGKTTTINELCNCLKMMNKKFLLCAPTGRAAKRMTESTGCEAQTLHRLLEYKPRGIYGTFLRNEKYPLVADYVIVDESSMLDVYMLNSLIKAISNKTSIIFIGDINQLPSISMGSVFKDMCDSGKIQVNYLTKVYRQSLDSYIVRNAYNIQNNKELEFNDDFVFHKVSSINEIEDIIKKLNFDFQILCPMRIGEIGTISMNQMMQKLKNNNEENQIYAYNKFLKVNDKVIQLDNNYNKEVYNGEIGVVSNITKDGVEIYYENNPIQNIIYKSNELKQLDLSYAISIHKSQGSEAENVILVVDGNKDFLSKELIYTAITRAKKKIIFISTFDKDFYSTLVTANNRMTNLFKA